MIVMELKTVGYEQPEWVKIILKLEKEVRKEKEDAKARK